MFRSMRRKAQALDQAACKAVLERNTAGVLAVAGDEGWPYAVPLSYAYDGKSLWFHCALQGHKLDSMQRSDKVSFCVVDQDVVVPEKYTTCFRSVIVFGRARVIADEKARRRALFLLAAKYSPEVPTADRDKEIEGNLGRTVVVEVAIEWMSGKEGAELMRQRSAGADHNV